MVAATTLPHLKHNYSTYTNLVPAIGSAIFVRFRQRNPVAVAFHQFRTTGFSFPNGSCRFTETDLKPVSVSTNGSRPNRQQKVKVTGTTTITL